MYTIYKHTNTITGKEYVGVTQGTMKGRFLSHLKEVARGSEYWFHQALRKYGKDAFTSEELFVTEDQQYCSDMEQYFISRFGTHGNGYNMTPGGFGKLSEETIKKVSDRMKKNNPMKNPETSRKVSEKLKGRKPPNFIEKMLDKTCPVCETVFQVRDTAHKRDKIFCGRSCQATYSNKRRHLKT